MPSSPASPLRLDDAAALAGRLRRQSGRRFRQLRRVWRPAEARALSTRAAGAALRRLAPPDQLEVRAADVLAADLTRPRRHERLAWRPGEAMTINWLMAPPSPGSGGHTTAFRLIRRLEEAGHLCRVYFYDVYGGDHAYYESVVRRCFHDVRGGVHPLGDGMQDAHAVFATSWQTAYPAYNDSSRGVRLYLVQDFEPSFYSAGAEQQLAENTYRMGFHAITAGPWLADKLAAEFSMRADAFAFGCDLERYHLAPSGPRDGIVFYARPEAPRRAYELGVMALELFAERRPDVTIHFYGRKTRALRFPFVNHGLVDPDGLNRIYNRCWAGLSLSMTNVSLVPHEMLAAGCIPVVNDAVHNRQVLDNDHVSYASPTPHALADALEAVIAAPDADAKAVAAAASVAGSSWDAAGDLVESVLRRELTTAAP
ncbi:MAG: glycosyltransferase family 1 protein [Acidimicrobiales bacterium]